MLFQKKDGEKLIHYFMILYGIGLKNMIKRTSIKELSKTCTGCGEDKPLDEFYKHNYEKSSCKYGRNSQCKDCIREKQRERWRDKRKNEKETKKKRIDGGVPSDRIRLREWGYNV
jgi:hypothetical protein